MSMKHFLAVLFLGIGVLGSNACLKRETSHVLYLAPSGAVTWVVHDRDVHSDESGAKRAQEESEFMRAVRSQADEPLVALEALGGRDAVTELLRAERPWEVRTSARFARADALAVALMRELGVQGDGSLTTAGNRTTLRVQWREEDDDGSEDSAVNALAEELSAYRIVMTEGRFVAASGFVVSQDGRVATFAEPGPTQAARQISLTWIVEP
jgi:hypothetical protein